MRGRADVITSFMHGNEAFFLTATLTSMLGTVLNMATPQIIKVAVDSILGQRPFALPGSIVGFLRLEAMRQAPLRSLLLCAAAIVFVALLSGGCTFGSRLTLALGSEKMLKSMRCRLYEHIQRLPFAWHVRNQTGEIIQRCTSDVEVIRNFVSNQLIEAFRTVFLVAVSMAVMFSMNVRISLIALALIPIIVLYTAIFYSRIARRFREADEAEGALAAVAQENLTGVRVVRAFGREQFEIDRFDERNNRFADFWIRLGRVQSYYWGIGDLFTGLQVMVIIVAGAVEAVAGNITLGEFLAFVSYNATLVWPVRGLGRILSEMSKMSVSADRIRYILDAEEEADPAGALTPPMNGDIRFEKIRFQYEGLQPVLHDIDFTIPAGSTFAILGATGSGKSTLMHLLDRLYDLPKGCGRITVGGVDIARMERAWVRKNVGLVLQEPFLFSRTIAENIGAARPGAGLEEIRHAARIACVDRAVEEFSEGYDTVVGERGVTLSGGQKQRVAIARMLMQGTPIMVFDDSLSAVDAQTDSQIRAALRGELGRATVILISHRITTLMQADRILVLEDGRIAEMGTHEELIRRDGVYKQIYDVQMSSDDRVLLAGETQEGGVSHAGL